MDGMAAVSSVALNSAGLAANCQAILRPETCQELVSTLRARHKGRSASCPLYPVSSGFNWGLGSRVAPAEGCVLLDLSALQRIVYLDLERGVAVVEPGVTQSQLARALVGSPFLLNCTASSAHTSILGSALERGLGTRRSRTEDLLGLHILQADGSDLRIGHMPDASRSCAWRHGSGPSLLNLFCQSNLGIAVGAAIALVPRSVCTRCMRVSAARAVLPKLLSVLQQCQRNGLTNGIIKVYNAAGMDAYGARGEAELTAYLFADGYPELVAARLRIAGEELRRAMPSVQLLQLDPASVSDNFPETALLHSFCGDPGYNDRMIEAIFGVAAQEVDTGASRCGWLFFLPMVPSCAEDLACANAILQRIGTTTPLRMGHTFNLLPEGVTDLVVSVRFDRITEAASAHALLDQLHGEFGDAGYFPYRLDVRHMQAARQEGGATLLRGIKNIIDPFGAIAPGRYQ